MNLLNIMINILKVEPQFQLICSLSEYISNYHSKHKFLAYMFSHVKCYRIFSPNYMEFILSTDLSYPFNLVINTKNIPFTVYDGELYFYDTLVFDIINQTNKELSFLDIILLSTTYHIDINLLTLIYKLFKFTYTNQVVIKTLNLKSNDITINTSYIHELYNMLKSSLTINELLKIDMENYI